MLMSRNGPACISRYLLQASNKQQQQPQTPSSYAPALAATTMPPLHVAAHNNHVEVIKLLLRHGVDVNYAGADGTCVHQAVLNGHVEVFTLL